MRAEGEIPLWPGHPEFYADTHEREVLVGTYTTREDGISGMDSRYSDGSRWEFIVWGAFGIRADNPTGITPVFVCGGFCSAYEVTYDLRIVASDVVAPKYSSMSPFS